MEIVTDALDTCEGLLRDLAGAERASEQARRETQRAIASRLLLFEHVPIAGVTTDTSGVIVSANSAGAALLNVSAKHLLGRPLLHFVEDREGFNRLTQRIRVAEEGRATALMSLRPRERAAVLVRALVVPESAIDASSWIWFLVPEADAEPRQTRSAAAAHVLPIGSPVAGAGS